MAKTRKIAIMGASQAGVGLGAAAVIRAEGKPVAVESGQPEPAVIEKKEIRRQYHMDNARYSKQQLDRLETKFNKYPQQLSAHEVEVVTKYKEYKEGK